MSPSYRVAASSVKSPPFSHASRVFSARRPGNLPCMCMASYKRMRTTIEMKPEHRSALLALSARRGQKGFSAILEEAIECYLQEQSDREKRLQTFLSVAGSLSHEEAEDLRQAVREVRELWR